MRTAIPVLLLAAAPCLATSYATPQRHDVFSDNRAFVLDVDPQSQVHTVYDVRDRARPLWSFSLRVWHFPFLLSNDGTVVATVAWKHVKVEDIEATDGVTFWTRDGVMRTHLLRDLCPDPPRTEDVGVGPIGEFWRTWYTRVTDNGDSFALRTTCGVECRFRYADGELVERRPVSDRTPMVWVVAVVGGLVLGFIALARWWPRRARKAGLDATAEPDVAPERRPP